MVVLIYLGAANKALAISVIHHNEDAFDVMNNRLEEFPEATAVTIVNTTGIYQYDIVAQDMQRVA